MVPWVFVLFSLGANVSAFEALEGTKTLDGTTYVWQVLGRTPSSLGSLPQKMGGAGGTPSIF